MQQDAFSTDDSYAPLDKQNALIELIFSFDEKARRALAAGADVQKISELPVREKIARAKAIPYDKYKTEYAKIDAEITDQLDILIATKEV